MRVQMLLVSALAIFAASVQAAPPRPPAPTSFTCGGNAASSMSEAITNGINDALLANSSNTITNSNKNPYWSFTVPQYCWSNLFGFQQSGCVGGETYDASTGKTTTILGVFNANVNVSLAQTSCTASKGAAGTWAATATWPKITYNGVLAIYPVTGGDIGVEIVMTVTNMVIKAQGTYSYTVDGSTDKLCVTGLDCTKSSATVSDVSVSAGLDGAALTSLPNVANKVESQITSKGNNITATLNESFARKVGKCKTVGVPLPPRSPRSPRAPQSPRVGGR